MCIRDRPNPGIAVERAEADRHLVTVRPVAAEERRAALRAEDLDRRAALRPVDAQQLLAGQEPEPLARHASLRQPERAGVLAAERAVAVVGAQKRQLGLEPHAAAQAAAANDLRGHRWNSGTFVLHPR